MRERDQILQLWRKTQHAGEDAVLATVVKTQGSSYRLPGARLLMMRTGGKAGSISGGCLEGDLRQKAWWLTEKGPTVQRYDTTPEGEIGTGFGLGCSGIIHLALERLRGGASDVLDALRQVKELRTPAVVCHILRPSGHAGQRLIETGRGASLHNLEEAALTRECARIAKRALETRQSEHVNVEGLDVFAETLLPPVRLLVFGAGDDAMPLVEMAYFLGWDIHVFDGRQQLARAERFPLASAVSVLEPGQNPSIASAIDPWTVAVVMTHSYSQDLNAVRELGSAPLRYLGILGPQKRSSQLLEDAGHDPARFASAGYSPMGLDIGADGPEQVAVSIMAEIQAVLNGRAGGFLRSRAGSIHSDESESSRPFVRSIVCA